MEQTRYFYCVDGTQVHGPVDRATLQQLYSTGEINAGTYLCVEGAQEWELLSMGDFALPPKPVVVPPPPPVDAFRAVKAPSHRTKWIFTGAAAVVLGGLILSYFLFRPAQPTEAQEMARIRAAIKSSNDAMLQYDRQQLKTNGHVEGYAAERVRQLQKVREIIGDGNLLADRMARATLDVRLQIQQRIADADEATKACDFDLLTLKSGDDVAAREEAIKKLQHKQDMMVEFLQNDEDLCRSSMVKEGFNEDEIRVGLPAMRRHEHSGTLIEIWESQSKLSGDMIALLDFLKQNASRWVYKDGRLDFADLNLHGQFDRLRDVMHGDWQRLLDLQKDFYEERQAKLSPQT